MKKVDITGITHKSKTITIVFIVVIDMVCIFLLFFGLCFDHCYPYFFDERSDTISPLTFDIILELVSIILAIILPGTEKRTWGKYNINDYDFKILEDKNRSPIYANLFIGFIILLPVDALCSIFSLNMTMICVFAVCLIFIIFFLVPGAIYILTADRHVFRTLRKSYGCCFSEGNVMNDPQFRKRCEQTEKIIDMFLVDYGLDKVISWLSKKSRHPKEPYKPEDIFFNTSYFVINYIDDLYKYDAHIFSEVNKTDEQQILSLLKILKDIQNKLEKGEYKDSADRTDLLLLSMQLGRSLNQLLTFSRTAINKKYSIEKIYANIESTLNNDINGMDNSQTYSDLNTRVVVTNSYFIGSVREKDFSCFNMLVDNAWDVWPQKETNYYRLFLCLLMFEALMAPEEYLKDEEKYKFSSDETLGKLQKYLNHGFIFHFDSQSFAELFFSLNYFFRITPSGNEWSVFGHDIYDSSTRLINEDKINEWWLLFVLINAKGNSQNFDDVFYLLPSQKQEVILELLKNSVKTKAHISNYYDFLKNKIKLNGLPSKENIEKLFDNLSNNYENYEKINKYYKKINSEGNIKKIDKEIAKSLDKYPEYSPVDISDNIFGCILDTEIKVKKNTTQHGEKTLVKKEYSFGDNIDIGLSIINKSFFAQKPLENIKYQKKELLKPPYNKKIVKKILNLKNPYKNAPNLVNCKNIPVFDDNITEKKKNSIKNIPNGPDYITLERNDLFYSDGAIKFNFIFLGSFEFIRPLTSNELNKIAEAYSRGEDGKYSYQDCSYNTLDELKTAIFKNECRLTLYGCFNYNINEKEIIIVREPFYFFNYH